MCVCVSMHMHTSLVQESARFPCRTERSLVKGRARDWSKGRSGGHSPHDLCEAAD